MDLKELLLKDLSARLPYEVIVNIKYSKEHGSSYRLRVCSEGDLKLNTDLLGLFIQEEIYLKPYLRPMSSMTEEEKEELKKLFDAEEVTNDSLGFIEGGTLEDYISQVSYDFCGSVIDWLLAHHFDYRGLIEKSLALEAPTGMY